MLKARNEVIDVITNLADSIALFFIQKNWGTAEKREIYRYGCEVLISIIINILLVLLCGIIFRMIRNAFLFYGVFLLIRRYCGGFHAETYLGCNAIFTGILSLALTAIVLYDSIPSIMIVIFAFISFLVVYRYSPLVHKNKRLSESEMSKYRVISLYISGIFLSVVFVFIMNYKQIATIISMAMLATACTMIIAVIQERRTKT